MKSKSKSTWFVWHSTSTGHSYVYKLEADTAQQAASQHAREQRLPHDSLVYTVATHTLPPAMLTFRVGIDAHE